MEMADEGRSQTGSGECPPNVRQRTSKRGPNADVSGRPQNVR